VFAGTLKFVQPGRDIDAQQFGEVLGRQVEVRGIERIDGWYVSNRSLLCCGTLLRALEYPA